MTGKDKGANPKLRIGLSLALIVGVAIVGNAVRIEAGGIRNALSARYWMDRATGKDLYDPELAVLKRGDRNDKAVVLTFDDGPHPDSAEMILDALDRYGVKATFFVVGERVYEHPEIVRRMIAEGHEVGNHTMTHPPLDKLNLQQVRAEIEGCEVAVERTTGHEMALLRPPHMRFTTPVAELCKSMGYTTVDYNVAAGDFVFTQADRLLGGNTEAVPEASPEVIAQRVLKQVRNGSIILLHDSPSTAEALPAILKSLAHDHFKCETVAQMMAALPKPVVIVANAPARRDGPPIAISAPVREVKKRARVSH